MNFLNLCKRLRQEAGYSGVGPASVTAQTGEAKRVVDWINDAWEEVQTMRPDWRFMLRFASVSLDAEASNVALPDDFDSFRRDEKKTVVVTHADGAKSFPEILDPNDMEMLKVREGEKVGHPQYVSARNGVLSVHPADKGPVDIALQYYRQPYRMTENTDEPDLPKKFHMLLVWKGLMSAGGYDEATNSWQRGSAHSIPIISDLQLQEAPKPKTAGPLA